ncbi:MAG: response regulator transcription factor [Clostridia bacterium]|nr:response regulator transcription factor [Lachnospiraceae bacterium]NCB99899.1 response regulator transcription factor [Clostridia bacterium]NCD03076.1 response regulator transcription factor [Clostridia bacterium]
MNIIIVDDDRLVSGALKTILDIHEEITVLAVGEDGRDAIELYNRYQPDVLLMDIRMKEMDGLEAASNILKDFPDARILLLTTFSDDAYIVKALRLGAKGYLLKQDYDSILPALQAVNSGQTVFGREIISKIPKLIQQSEGYDYAAHDINPRELEIIRLIADGLSNREIASELFLSDGTVRNYLSSILDKLNLRDRTQVAVFYYQHR